MSSTSLTRQPPAFFRSVTCPYGDPMLGCPRVDAFLPLCHTSAYCKPYTLPTLFRFKGLFALRATATPQCCLSPPPFMRLLPPSTSVARLEQHGRRLLRKQQMYVRTCAQAYAVVFPLCCRLSFSFFPFSLWPRRVRRAFCGLPTRLAQLVLFEREGHTWARTCRVHLRPAVQASKKCMGSVV